MKRHLALLPAVLTALLVATAAPAAAQTPPAEAADTAVDQGYYIEAGVGADEDRISDAVRRVRDAGGEFYVVLLLDDPAGGATTYAGSVLTRIGSGTVLVLSATQFGMESDEFGESELRAALDRGNASDSSDAAFTEAVVAALYQGAVPVPIDSGTTSTSSGGGSGAGLWIMLGFIGLLVALVWWAIRRQRRQSAASEEKMVAEARKEIKSQLDSMANTILEISDRVSASESKQDNRYLEEAGATYGTALEEYEQALDLKALEAMSDRLDEARWQLDAAAALAYGREVPPKPEKEVRHQCFFDPNHPEATELADLETSAGTKKVRVCKDDAEKLRRGQQPKPRMIRVAGRNVPAPMAPRSHGGGGMDWLNVFSVVLGGMAQKRSYDWSRGRSGGGLFGSSRSSGSSGTSSRRSSSSRSSGSSRTRSRAGGSRRGGRRRR